jgi:hypothetical protein
MALSKKGSRACPPRLYPASVIGHERSEFLGQRFLFDIALQSPGKMTGCEPQHKNGADVSRQPAKGRQRPGPVLGLPEDTRSFGCSGGPFRQLSVALLSSMTWRNEP